MFWNWRLAIPGKKKCATHRKKRSRANNTFGKVVDVPPYAGWYYSS